MVRPILAYIFISPLLFLVSSFLLEVITNKLKIKMEGGNLPYFVIPIAMILAGLGILILFK